MRELLLALAVTLGFGRATPNPILNAIETVAGDEDTARLMLVWGIHESSLRNGAVGDGGLSRCWLQIKYLGDLDELSCAKAWIGLLKYDEQKCGGRRAALGAIASGHCGGAPKLVQRRLDRAGVTLP
ncbi:MAG: hypothetical protein OK454_05820 [Thaumarchaeota archaeon]|nr:hypothetical protein [Nitrososphaerota archaeon]